MPMTICQSQWYQGIQVMSYSQLSRRIQRLIKVVISIGYRVFKNGLVNIKHVIRRYFGTWFVDEPAQYGTLPSMGVGGDLRPVPL